MIGFKQIEFFDHTRSRSSYFGIIDLAEFKKDRSYLYHAHWWPDLPMVHSAAVDLAGSGRAVTPVHVFTSGVEAELFLNGKSLGRKQRGEYEYRTRWDDVIFQPGELKVVAYKNGKEWATETVRTAEAPAKLALSVDRSMVPGRRHRPLLHHRPRGGRRRHYGSWRERPLQVHDRRPRSAMHSRQALVVVRTLAGRPGTIRVSAQSGALQGASVTLHSLAAAR